jgi:glyoxylase-like metal-dependent hydrolase (beta-lactamase superfamily II)
VTPVQIADGVHRCGTELVNWYLVEDAGRVTIVDCGAPGYLPQLDPALEAIGRTRDDVAAVVLTHCHSDHVGFAERLRSESGTPVWVPEGDQEMVRTGKNQKPERSVLPYLRYPFAYRMLSHLARNGAMRIPKVAEFRTYAAGERLDVPGHPLAIHAPGHTRGQCALQFEQALLVGDVLCTLNPLTGRRGPQIPPAAFNVDSKQALASLDALPGGLVAPGHGDPVSGDDVVERARAVGIS